MARLVDANARNSAHNTYGRAIEAVPERPMPIIQVIKGYGTVRSTGVCPDGSTCTTAETPTEVEFTLNIYRRGNHYKGEVYIVNYDTRKKINSNQLIYYQDHDGAYVLCIFSVTPTNGGCSYELIINLTPCGCGTTGRMYAYVAPIYNQGLNVGGTLTEGEIIFYDNCQRNHTVPVCNHLPRTESLSSPETISCNCLGPNIGVNDVEQCDCNCLD